ncbi:MAG: outer membrane beta-barrel protein, partial [Verrucomicrobia bacterium]|nr:outer membrane beta-barrel protein [Verrucomicrobiota bacterium]
VGLRGFYDDNYLIAPRDSSNVLESWGFSVTPTLSLNIPLEQTYFGFDFTYSGQWYAQDNHWDNSYLASGVVNHSFTEQVNLEVSDRFVYSDRPELTDPTLSTIERTDQNNVYNDGRVQLSIGLSRRLGIMVAYRNQFYDYQNENPTADTIPPGFPGNPTSASLAALLNRIQQLIPIDLRHQTGPTTVTFIGYSFGMVDYTSNEYLGFNPVTFQGQRADIRNNRSNYGYIGIEHNFTPVLNLGVKGGAQFTDYYNDPLTGNNVTPYGDISLGYLYTTGSRAQIGYTLSQGATDVYSPNTTTGQVTQNRLVSSLFARVDHQIIPQLHAGLFGQWQLGDYNGGQYDGTTQNLYLLGASLRYDFNRFLSAELGYTFDYQDNAIPNQGYTRNRVSLGVTATY